MKNKPINNLIKRILTVYFISTSFITQAQTYSGTGGPIVDLNTTIFNISVTSLNANSLDSLFGIEQICIDATHTYDADLTVNLQSPDGTTITLFSGIGGSGNNFTNTCLNSNAASSILA